MFIAFAQLVESFAAVNEPQKLGHQALKEARFEEAYRWFSLSEKDFPAAPTAEEALLQQAVILLSKELAYNKLIKLWTEGSPLERVENNDSKMKLEIRAYEDENKTTLNALMALGDRLCKKHPPIPISTALPKFDPTADALKNRIKKGEWLRASDRKALEQEEWKINYAGLMLELIGPLSETEDGITVSGTAKWEVLLHALGTRLWIAQAFYHEPRWIPLSKTCLETTLELTQASPYSDLHQKTKETLLAISAKQAKKH